MVIITETKHLRLGLGAEKSGAMRGCFSDTETKAPTTIDQFALGKLAMVVGVLFLLQKAQRKCFKPFKALFLVR